MRYWFLFIVAATLCMPALAQTLTISRVVHEPGADQVGDHIRGIQESNPNYDPDQPTGEPEFLNVYGNGTGYHNDLADESDRLYAVGGTTTHDLVELTNNSGEDIEIDLDSNPPTLSLSPTKDVDGAPEQSSPDPTATHEIFGYEDDSIVVPNGSSRFVWLLRTKWAPRLDTSPREYVAIFSFSDISGPIPETKTVETTMWVPDVGGQDGGGCTVTNDRNIPVGLWIIAAGGIAAIARRRRTLDKAQP